MQAHQREQAERLWLPRHVPRDQRRQPGRVFGEVAPGRCRASTRQVALGKHQIEYCQHFREPPAHVVVGRQTVGDVGSDDLAPRPHDALGNSRFRGQESVRDFGSGKAADRPQGQRDLRRTGEGGVTAREHQTHPVIRLSGDWLLQLRELGAVAGVSAHLVERATAGDGQQPGTWPIRDAIDRPALQRHQQRILDDFLCDSEIAQDVDQGSGEPSRLLSENLCEGGVYIGHGY